MCSYAGNKKKKKEKVYILWSFSLWCGDDRHVLGSAGRMCMGQIPDRHPLSECLFSRHSLARGWGCLALGMGLALCSSSEAFLPAPLRRVDPLCTAWQRAGLPQEQLTSQEKHHLLVAFCLIKNNFILPSADNFINKEGCLAGFFFQSRVSTDFHLWEEQPCPLKGARGAVWGSCSLNCNS